LAQAILIRAAFVDFCVCTYGQDLYVHWSSNHFGHSIIGARTPSFHTDFGTTTCRNSSANWFHSRSRRESEEEAAPIRGQRMRSINFVAMLKKEISENPEGFEFDKIELLPSISTNEKRRMKLRQNIEEFRLQAMINKLQKSGIGSCTDTPNTERSVIDKSQPQAFEEHTCRWVDPWHAIFNLVDVARTEGVGNLAFLAVMQFGCCIHC